MAESASTGNSGTTGNGNSGTGTTSTSTSTSSGGPAAPGSQSSSNGSFSTGNNGNGGNNGGSNNNGGVGPGLSFGAGLASNTGSGWTSNSNGNNGGGLNGTTTGFTGFASDNFGQGWGGSYSISPNAEGKHTIKPNAEGKLVVTQKYSKPQSQALYMTVDEVYGKGNQSMVESQGDYEAASNEKSNVETSTFGKQDEISVTPVSVTRDEGLVNNDAIQSVEGLNFQQKDKASQEVMEAKKSRDDAEAEDNSNGMRNQLKAVAEKDAEKDNNDFQVGEETNSKEKAAFIEAEKAYKDIEAKVAEKEAELAKAEEEFNDLDNAWFDVHQPRLNAAKDALNDVIAAATRDNEENGKTDPTYDISYLAEVAANPEDYADAAKVAEQLNEVPGLQGNKYLSNIKQCVEDVARVSKDFYEVSQKHEEAQQRYNQLTYELADLMDSKGKAEAAYNKAKESYDSNFIAENPVDKKANELPPGVEVVSLDEDRIAQLVEQENNAKLTELNNLENDLNEVNKSLEEAKNAKSEADKKAEEAEQNYQEVLSKKSQADSLIQDLTSQIEQLNDNPITDLLSKTNLGYFPTLKSNLAKMAESYGVEVGDVSKANVSEFKAIGKKAINEVEAIFEQDLKTAENELADAQKQQKDIETNQNVLVSKAKELESKYNKAQKDYNTWKTEAWSKVENANVESPTVETETVTTEAPAYKATIKAARDEINNAKDLTPEQKAEADTVLGNVESAADAMQKATNDYAKNPNDISIAQKYVVETARCLKALEDAKGDKTLKNTDYNKTFTRAVAAANDFDVTMPDGTTKSYAEFATEMATKSPELAKGLYEAKAEGYEKNGHKVLAAIETAKSKMVMTWLGSKFTFADNQVRNQFNQMAKTDMRATYATYNDVLNDETGKYSEADKAEAFDAIQQANSLMTASVALQASTGFLSGIGDSMSDGVYGVTDPTSLNGYQKALNTASNFAKIALGLGVLPGANEAYQNMYYMAGAKVNESGLFGKDFDSDGFALCQEYGNNAAVGMIVGAGELAAGVALMFNPATSKMGINLAIDSVQTFLDGLYGVQKEVNKSIKYSSEILNYFNEAKSIAAETGNKEATGTIDSAIKQIEDFQLKSDEVGDLDNWLEGSGSNTADNGKFNQALSYDEWLKLIEADPVMQEYAKSLNR